MLKTHQGVLRLIKRYPGQSSAPLCLDFHLLAASQSSLPPVRGEKRPVPSSTEPTRRTWSSMAASSAGCSVNATASVALLSPKGLFPPHRTAFLLMKMSVCQKLGWPDSLPKRWQGGWEHLCSTGYSFVMWGDAGVGGVCMNTHAYLNSTPWVQLPHPSAPVPKSLHPLHLVAK